jgi:uncharacterized repeat protein (TIGR01451 family)
MKTFIFFCTLMFAGISAKAQIISIPDANFKATLLSSDTTNFIANDGVSFVKIDANSNGEIEVGEVTAVKELSLSSASIESLEGIESFINLDKLYCNGNQIDTFNANLPQLTFLNCDFNGMTQLELDGLPALKSLSCNINQLTTLDLSSVPNLQFIQCEANLLTALDFSQQTMTGIDCAGNQLTQLSIGNFATTAGGVTGNGEIRIGENQLTSFEFVHPNANLEIFDISNNPLTSATIVYHSAYYFSCANTLLTQLDLSQIPILGYEIAISDNSDLEYLNIKNGNTDFCIPDNFGDCTNYSINLTNNPSLQFICVDDLSISGISEAEYYQSETTTTSSYCSFTPGGNYNTITGNIKLDLNGNGCDLSDEAAPQISLALSSGTTNQGTTFTNSNGNYTSYISYDNQTITPQFENPYFSVSPASFTSLFSGMGNTEVVDFCIAPNGVHPDLQISIVPLIAARPGFDATYKIVYKNKGTQTQSGLVILNFDDAVLDFISATPNIDSQSANTLSWNFTNLEPFESREMTFTANVNSPMETPPVNIDDILAFNAQINAAETDETPDDNLFIFSQAVIGSFDPNDKAVSKTSMALTALDEYLYYTVRFQNTGTAAAEPVVVKDKLSNKLDLSTLQMVSSSHTYRSTLTSGNKLEFFFEGIDLSASSVDEPTSHGYITFKIKPKNNLALNDIIENTAGIYFDFNFPVVTNTVSTTVSELGTDNFATINFSLYPNPVKNTLTIALESAVAVKSISIFNTLGQLVKILPNTFEDNIITADVSDLDTATYFVQVISEKGKTSKKLIKL